MCVCVRTEYKIISVRSMKCNMSVTQTIADGDVPVVQPKREYILAAQTPGQEQKQCNRLCSQGGCQDLNHRPPSN